jgi:hypothetical protein
MMRVKCFYASVILMCTGCATTTMQTAEQLENGQVVVSGALDSPGYFIMPRLSGLALVGVGGVADIGAHLGTAFLSVNGGASARLYLNEWLKLGVQGDYIVVVDERQNLASATVQLTGTYEYRDARNPFFWGSGYIYGGPSVGISDEIVTNRWQSTEPTAIAVGFVFGQERKLTDAFNLQSEMTYYPLHFVEGRWKSQITEPYFFPIQTFQAGIGLNYRSRRNDGEAKGTTPYPLERFGVPE